MEINIVFELEKDKKLHEYLKNHSYWYRFLNRDSEALRDLLKEYKNYKRENNLNKVNDMVENIEMVSSIMKVME